jgi:hypothetical protein
MNATRETPGDVFHLGFAPWLDDPAGSDFATIAREGFDQLRAVASGSDGR